MMMTPCKSRRSFTLRLDFLGFWVAMELPSLGASRAEYQWKIPQERQLTGAP